MQLVDKDLWHESQPSISEEVVHLWCIKLEASSDDGLPDVLTDDEKNKIARIQAPVAARHARQSRILLRLLLSHYINQSPQNISLLLGDNGKPYLPETQTKLQFNVTHTDGLMLVAFGLGMQLGVDCEHNGRQVRFDGIAKRQFSPEEYQWMCENECKASECFWRLWVAKEACLKVGGMGLTKGLDAFQFKEDSEHSLSLRRNPHREIVAFLALPSIYPGYQAALAANNSVQTVLCCRVTDNAMIARLAQSG